MNREEVITEITKLMDENFRQWDKFVAREIYELVLSEASGVVAKKECTKCNYGTKECPESLPNCDHGYISRELMNVELLEAAKMLINEINDPDPSLSAYEGPITLPSGERLELKDGK